MTAPKMSFSYGSFTPNTSLAIAHTQNTAPVLEFRCLFTADLRRKQKRWQDGKLKFHTHNNRVMVYDEKSNFVGDSHWREEFPLGEGEELDLERGGIMVEVGECVGKTEQDLTELVDKRIKDKEDRAAAKAAKGTPVRASMQTEGTPGVYPQHKPLNTMLTPSGHYGRAMMPTTSPFEDRQRLAGGNAEGKENERPAKRQKINDAPSKNGYAQNLMGATLSLSSSRPPSSTPIRYEPMKLKSAPRPEPVDLTLDDDEETSTTRPRGNDERSNEKQGQRQSKLQKRQRKLPPPKSTYAGNLTGTTLNLSMPPIRRDSGLPKPRLVEPSRPIELDNSSSEEKSDDDNYPQKTVQSESRIVSKGSKPPKQDSISMESSEENIEPSKKTPSKGNAANVKMTKPKKKTYLPLNSSESESDNNHQVSKDVTTASKITKGKQTPKRDPTSLSNSEDDIQPKKKARTTKITKDLQRDSRSSSANLLEPRGHVSKISSNIPNSARSSSVAEIQPDVNISSLRIKSKPPRRMMMHVDRSITRTPSNSSLKTQAAPKPPEHLQEKANEIVMSQDTMQLNAFCQKQEAKLQARLAGKKKVHQEPQIPSSASTDSGINHQTIDILLSRKTIQIIRSEPSRNPTPNTSRRKDPSPPFSMAKTASECRPLPANTSAMKYSHTHSSPAFEAVKDNAKESLKHTDPQPAFDPFKTIPTEPALATIPATTDSDISSSSPAFEFAKVLPRTKSISAPVGISAAIPPTHDSNLGSSLKPSIALYAGAVSEESDIRREITLDGEMNSKPVGKQLPTQRHPPTRPVIQETQPQHNEIWQQKPTQEFRRTFQSHEDLLSVVHSSNVTANHAKKTVSEKPQSPEMITCDLDGILAASRNQKNSGRSEEVGSTEKVTTSRSFHTEPEIATRSKSPQPKSPKPKVVNIISQPKAWGDAQENEDELAVPESEKHFDKLAKPILPSKTNPVSVERFEKEFVTQSSSNIPPKPVPHKPLNPPKYTQLPSIIPSIESSQSPEPTAFLCPELSSSVQFATAHFRSILKSPAKDNIATKPPMPEVTPEAAVLEPQAKTEAEPSLKKRIVKPSPKSSPVLPEESQQRPGQGTLEEAESTPVTRMTDIPTASSNFIPPQVISRAKVANPATTKGKGKSLSELAASTINANEIQTPSSIGAGSATGLGFNVMPPPAAPAPQISRTTAAAGIDNNIAKRKYPAPPPRVSVPRVGQIETSGGGWEGKVLILGGNNGNDSGKKENGVGVKDGPWCREAFDLFGEWVRPVV